MKTVAERETGLRSRLAELEASMQAIQAALEQTPNPDVEERSVEREGDEVLEDLGNAEQLEVRQIEAALTRVSEGEYGYCVDCGDKVSEERLDILPQTPFCRTCAAKH